MWRRASDLYFQILCIVVVVFFVVDRALSETNGILMHINYNLFSASTSFFANALIHRD